MQLAVIGARGGVGAHVVERGLKEGHDVVAFARTWPDSPQRRSVDDPQLHSDRGASLARVALDVSDSMQVRRSLDLPLDAIAWCVGVTSTSGPTVAAASLPAVLAAAEDQEIARVVSVSSAAVAAPNDRRSIPARAASTLSRRLTAAVVADKQHELGLLSDSAVSWTAVRPSRMSDERELAWRLDNVAPGPSALPVPRASVADAIGTLIDPHTIEAAKWDRAAPFIWV